MIAGFCSYQQKDNRFWLGQFEAMKSPCEIWLETDEAWAKPLIEWAANETWRIEKKYSRFLVDSVLSHLNQNAGSWQTLDDETQSLLKFADECWRLTEGMIDITIGAYLKHWRFDGKTPPPLRKQLKKMASYVGWEKVGLQQNKLFLPQGMQLDLGGIGKEYAVDTVALALTNKLPEGGIMVNFGGDLFAIRPRLDKRPWTVGIESILAGKPIVKTVELFQGAIATSGSTKRYAVDKRGRALGHILNPKTGWPVAGGPASVTVVADTATQSGMLSTYAMLRGGDAESFLQQQEVEYYLQ